MSENHRGNNWPVKLGVILVVLAGVIGGLVWIFASGTPSATVHPAGSVGITAATAPVPASAMTPWTSEGVYTADFSNTAPREFSGGAIHIAKTTKQKYLGPFTAKGVVVTLNDVPVHRAVRVTFDLALFGSWNGTNPYWGPDIWSCDLEGGPSLVHTTFCNTGWFSNNDEQSYPDEFPLPDGESPHLAWAGGSEHGTLGDMHTWANVGAMDTSAVYHMDWMIPHSDANLILNFTSKPKKRDKTFALLSFRVEAMPSLTRMTDTELSEAWKSLNQDDPGGASNAILNLLSSVTKDTTRPSTAEPANSAVWKLIATGDQAVDFIGAQLKTAAAPAQGYALSRIRHVLEVIHTPAAAQLLASLPTVPGG